MKYLKQTQLLNRVKQSTIEGKSQKKHYCYLILKISECPAALVTMLISVRGLGSGTWTKMNQHKNTAIKNQITQVNVQTCVHSDRLWQFDRVENIREDGSWQLILDLYKADTSDIVI